MVNSTEVHLTSSNETTCESYESEDAAPTEQMVTMVSFVKDRAQAIISI